MLSVLLRGEEPTTGHIWCEFAAEGGLIAYGSDYGDLNPPNSRGE
jgi:hypothetical protein